MACMEHMCRECGKMVFDNHPGSPGRCPQCGHDDWSHTWDEEWSYRQDERADARGDDDDAA
jgi:ribosomal protein L37E